MENREFLHKIKSELNNSFDELIERVILFGSRVDNTARKNSDYDILIILNKKITWQKKDLIIDLISELNIKYDIIIDVHMMSTPDLQTIKGKQPYIQKALETGIAV